MGTLMSKPDWADKAARGCIAKMEANCNFDVCVHVHKTSDCPCLEGIAEALRQAKRDALAWTDHDEPLPEDDAINAAHPLRTGAHDIYVEAFRLVGAKRSKGALVDLVNWLLVEAKHKDPSDG